MPVSLGKVHEYMQHASLGDLASPAADTGPIGSCRVSIVW